MSAYTQNSCKLDLEKTLPTEEPLVVDCPPVSPISKISPDDAIVIKKLFIPDTESDCFVYADYSQLELRLAAHLSRDPVFVDAFLQNQDLHSITAKTICGYDKISAEDRQLGKTVNFALIYGAGSYRLQDEIRSKLGVEKSIEDLDIIRRRFFETYSGYKRYLDNIQTMVFRYGVVVSPFGRIRRLPQAKEVSRLDYRKRAYSGKMFANFSDAKRAVNHALKQAFNFGIQSMGASIMKRAMLELDRRGFDIVNQVHDAIYIQVARKEATGKMKMIKNILETAVKLRVPLIAEPKILDSFSER